jgi:hypothetical protein
VNFLVSKRARRQIEAMQAWWSKNRPSAPWLFLDELAQAERLLRENPTFGVVYDSYRGSPVRRVLLSRTRKHLYYRYSQERDELIATSSRSSSFVSVMSATFTALYPRCATQTS